MASGFRVVYYFVHRKRMIQQIKNTLPNFPDEVIETWLLPFAVSEGWPPVIGSDDIPLERWGYLLPRKPWSEF